MEDPSQDPSQDTSPPPAQPSPDPSPPPSQLSPNADSITLEATAPEGTSEKKEKDELVVHTSDEIKQKAKEEGSPLVASGSTDSVSDRLAKKNAKYNKRSTNKESKRAESALERLDLKLSKEAKKTDNTTNQSAVEEAATSTVEEAATSTVEEAAISRIAARRPETKKKTGMKKTSPRVPTESGSIDSGLRNSADSNIRASNPGDNQNQVSAQQEENINALEEGVHVLSNDQVRPGAFPLRTAVVENSGSTVFNVSHSTDNYSENYSFSQLPTAVPIQAELLPDDTDKVEEDIAIRCCGITICGISVNSRNRASKRMCVALVVLLLLAGGIAAGVILSQKKDPEETTSAPTSTCIHLSMNVGSAGDQISWLLMDCADNVQVQFGDSYQDYETVEYDECFIDSGCYDFDIRDSFGDGFNGGGDYILSADGVIVDQSSENFGFEKNVRIS